MSKLIFLVDDTDSILTVAASALEDDYRVLTMSSARKMFELLAKKMPDMIILDIEMPEMNGFEAIAGLKENPEWKNIPVLFLTGYIDEDILSRIQESGAIDVIEKSELTITLLDRVNSYFE